jgi:cold shock CspA family protein
MPFYSSTVKERRRRATMAASPYERRGVPAAGRIIKIMVGQGHGFIRLTDDREVYFHRADLEESTSINDLTIGDIVAFDHVRRTPALVTGCRGATNRDDRHRADLSAGARGKRRD